MKKISIFVLATILLGTMSLPAFAADTKAPSDVEGFEVTATSDKQVSLSWDAASDDTAVKGYKVHYGLKSVSKQGEAYDKNEDAGNVLQYNVKNLENDKKYYFSVVAYDGATPPNESARWATEVSATPSKDAQAPQDKDAPTVVDAEAINMMEVKVEFSEEVVLPEEDPQDSFTIENEDTFEALQVLEAKMDEEDKTNKTVILTTAAQNKTASYKLTVGIDIKDKAGNGINSGTSDTAIFVGSDLEKPAVDTSGPEVVKVEAVDETHILVNFNETIVLSIDPSKNFMITTSDNPSRELIVLGVKLGVNLEGKTDAAAVITTGPQEDMKYTLTVSGLKDEDGNDVNAQKKSAMFQGVKPKPTDGGNGDGGGGKLPAPKDVAKFMAEKMMEADKYVIKLTWRLPSEDRTNVASQNLYMSTDKGKNYEQKAQLAADAAMYEAKDLMTGEYWFKLTQKNTEGTESKGVITKVILGETGPGVIGLLIGSMVLGRVVTRRKK